jgi:Tfp pilus assembly protein PilN
MGPVIVPVLTVLAGVAVRAIAYAELLARLRWQERQQHTLTELARALPPGCQLHEVGADGSRLHLETAHTAGPTERPST